MWTCSVVHINNNKITCGNIILSHIEIRYSVILTIVSELWCFLTIINDNNIMYKYKYIIPSQYCILLVLIVTFQMDNCLYLNTYFHILSVVTSRINSCRLIFILLNSK